MHVRLVLLAAGVYVWASITTRRVLAQTFETHLVDFPIPFPIDAAEVSAMGLTEDAARSLAEREFATLVPERIVRR